MNNQKKKNQNFRNEVQVADVTFLTTSKQKRESYFHPRTQHVDRPYTGEIPIMSTPWQNENNLIDPIIRDDEKSDFGDVAVKKGRYANAQRKDSKSDDSDEDKKDEKAMRLNERCQKDEYDCDDRKK
jgi:hypothetical protein